MQKPIAPVKLNHPVSNVRLYKIVVLVDDKLVLIDGDDFNEDLHENLRRVSFSHLQQIRELTQAEFCIETEGDANDSYFWIYYDTPNPNFEAEMTAYEVYDHKVALKEFEIQKQLYAEYQKEIKRATLLEELENL